MYIEFSCKIQTMNFGGDRTPLFALRFLIDVFSFVVHPEFEVHVLAPDEFRWKIVLGEDLEPVVVLVSFA